MVYGERFILALVEAILPALGMTLLHSALYFGWSRQLKSLDVVEVTLLAAAYFFLLWSIVGVTIGLRAGGARNILKAALWSGIIGAVGYLLVLVASAVLWMFAFFLWWPATWMLLGAVHKSMLREQSSHASSLAFLGSLLSVVPLSCGIVMMVQTTPLNVGTFDYMKWWGLSFYIPLVFLISARVPEKAVAPVAV